MSLAEAQPARLRALSPLELVLFCIFAGAFMFDFRSQEEGGIWIQWAFLAASGISFVLLFLALAFRRRRAGAYEIGLTTLVVAVLLPAYAFFGALYNGAPLGNFARLELRYVLVFEAVAITYMMGRAGIDLGVVIRTILVTSVVGLAWHIYHTVYVLDFDFASGRYRLAPIITASIVGICVAAIFAGRWLYLPPLLFGLYAIQISATRSYLGALAALYITTHIYAFAGRERRKLIAMALFDLLLVAFAFWLYNRGAFDNWVQRFIQNETAAGDTTLLTRLAEYHNQWTFLTSGWKNALFGAGLGSIYTRDLGVMRIAILSRHVRLDEVATFEFGHSLWIYSAYYGGILGGWMLPFMFIAGFVKSAANAFRSHRSGNHERYLIDLQCSAVLVMVMATGLFAHPFGSRLFAVQFGFLAAIPFIYPLGWDLETRAERKRRRRRTAAPHRAPAGAGEAFT